MSFFDDQPATPPPFPPPQRVSGRGTADDTLGQPMPFAAVLAKNDDVAVLVSGMVAYPSGFSLNVSAIRRMEWAAPLHPFDMHPWPGQPERDASKILLFGMRFADGSKVTSGRNPFAHLHSGQPMARTLMPGGGGGGGRRWTQAFVCSPLPPPGPMSFVVQWLEYDIAQTEVEIDASLILDAADRADPLWPDDVGLPDAPSGLPEVP